MKVSKIIALSCMCILILTGCWDQHLLKDTKLILTTGYDLTPDGKVLGTIVIPMFSSAEGGATVTGSNVVSAKGDTSMDTEDELNLKVSGQLDASKMIVILFGEEYAKRDIQSGLDVFYRDPKRSLVANVAVVKGRAIDLLNIKLQEKGSISEYLNELFEGAQVDTVIPRQTRPMYSDFFDPGVDIILPLIEAEKKDAKFTGLALFNGSKYTGHYLSIPEATIYMLLANKKNKVAGIKIKVHENKVPEIRNYIYINVLKMERDLNVKVQDPDTISATIRLDCTVEIVDFPENHLDSKQKIDALQPIIAEEITMRANHIIKKLQRANSDSLAIGRHLIAFHHDTWENTDWEKQYPKMNIETKVNVKITKHGIFN